jgi:hypothetical protein
LPGSGTLQVFIIVFGLVTVNAVHFFQEGAAKTIPPGYKRWLGSTGIISTLGVLSTLFNVLPPSAAPFFFNLYFLYAGKDPKPALHRRAETGTGQYELATIFFSRS